MRLEEVHNQAHLLDVAKRFRTSIFCGSRRCDSREMSVQKFEYHSSRRPIFRERMPNVQLSFFTHSCARGVATSSSRILSFFVLDADGWGVPWSLHLFGVLDGVKPVLGEAFSRSFRDPSTFPNPAQGMLSSMRIPRTARSHAAKEEYLQEHRVVACFH